MRRGANECEHEQNLQHKLNSLDKVSYKTVNIEYNVDNTSLNLFQTLNLSKRQMRLQKKEIPKR